MPLRFRGRLQLEHVSTRPSRSLAECRPVAEMERGAIRKKKEEEEKISRRRVSHAAAFRRRPSPHLRRARRAAAQPREEEDSHGGKRTGGPRQRGDASSRHGFDGKGVRVCRGRGAAQSRAPWGFQFFFALWEARKKKVFSLSLSLFFSLTTFALRRVAPVLGVFSIFK